MEYITHPMIRPGTVGRREYQVTIAESAKNRSTLVVLPTGLGKTPVSLLVMAHRLQYGKILMMAPTKPLVSQHEVYFRKHLLLDTDQVNLLTGTIPVKKRKGIWDASRVVLATPQTIQNDLNNQVYSLKDFSLIVFDECHRGVGDYAYRFVSEIYMQQNPDGQMLALTASPGGDKSKIDQIKKNFDIAHVESRSETDPDVSPYLHKKEMEIVRFTLPDDLRLTSTLFSQILQNRFSILKTYGFNLPNVINPPMKVLNGVKMAIDGMIQSDDPEMKSIGYQAVSYHAEIMKVRHGVGLCECQGTIALQRYLYKIKTGASKADVRLANSPEFKEIMAMAETWVDEQHPKITHLPAMVKRELDENPDSRILIFASLRDTVSNIVSMLKKEGVSVVRFVGQASKSDDEGLSQKKQIETVKKFADGEYQVMVATSVAEEGLDIPSVDLIIFYEPVPSEVRSIQRRGRTGRFGNGRVITMVTTDTVDDVYLAVATKKEEKMKDRVAEMRKRAPISIIDY